MKRFTVIALALVMSLTMMTACSSEEEVDTTVGTIGAEPPDTDGDDDGDSLEKEPENTYPPTSEEEN